MEESLRETDDRNVNVDIIDEIEDEGHHHCQHHHHHCHSSAVKEKDEKDNINVRAAVIHMIGDMV